MDKPIPKQLDEFFSAYTKLRFKKGEIILRAEDQPSGVYYLKKGFVREYLISERGETMVLHVYKPGAFFPMTWAINNTPNTYHFEAASVAEIWRAPKEDVLFFLRQYPDVLLNLTGRLLKGLMGLLNRMEMVILDNAYDKTILLLLYYAKSFGVETDEGIELKIPLTHREISAWIGTTRETASLQMEALVKKKFVKYNGRRLTITNVKALEKEIKRA